MSLLRQKTFLLLLPVLLCCSSCTRIFLASYGIKNVKRLSDKKIERMAQRYGIPSHTTYALDSVSYDRFLSSIKNRKKDTGFSFSFVVGGMHWGNETAHHLGQPIQYLLFDRQGKLLSWHINCEAGGWPNLKWNGHGDFNRFPPATGVTPDSNISLGLLQPYFSPVQHPGPAAVGDYTCVVYWSRFMGRQSRRMVRQAITNSEKAAPGTKISFVFVNNDNYFYRTFRK